MQMQKKKAKNLQKSKIKKKIKTCKKTCNTKRENATNGKHDN